MSWYRTIPVLLGFALMAQMSIAQSASSGAHQLQILVPAYFYPGQSDRFWPAMTRAARRVPITAILNPGSGPGIAADANYQQAVKRFRAAGGRVVGYVHTNYAKRPATLVAEEVRRYRRFYQVDGFFIDEMSSRASRHSLNYYRSIYQKIKSLDPKNVVIGNPGTNSDIRFLNEQTADTLINFESPGPVHTGYRIDRWVAGFPAKHFGQLVYRAESSQEMRAAIARAVSQNAGFVFVTDDAPDNPWDTLPGYWADKVRCIEQINAGRACR